MHATDEDFVRITGQNSDYVLYLCSFSFRIKIDKRKAETQR